MVAMVDRGTIESVATYSVGVWAKVWFVSEQADRHCCGCAGWLVWACSETKAQEQRRRTVVDSIV